MIDATTAHTPHQLGDRATGNGLDAGRAEELILETRGLTKQFSGFYAVRNVDLQIRKGTIHALIGPNGAGKTTCFNLLTKFLQPTGGRSGRP